MIDFTREYQAHVEAGMVQQDLDLELEVFIDSNFQAIVDEGPHPGPAGPAKLQADKEFYYACHGLAMAALFSKEELQ